MLEVADMAVSYEGSRILRGVNLAVPDRSLVCLMGRNGVGKTTTLKSIIGLTKTDAGTIKFGGKEIAALPPDDRARLGLAYVPQGRDIFPNLTVWENLKISLVIHGTKPNGELEHVLELFPVLKEMLQRKGGVLSGGQQQQLAIARSLVTKPTLLVLDEPTEGIQPSIIKDIGRAISYLRNLGHIAIVLVEQYLDFACELGDNFAVMDRGAVKYACDRSQLDPGEISRQMAL
jgi:urea transport system ATP-binding protein